MSADFLGVETKKKDNVTEEVRYKRRSKNNKNNLSVYELTGPKGESQLSIDASDVIPSFGVSKGPDNIDKINELTQYKLTDKRIFSLSESSSYSNLPPIIRHGALINVSRISPLKLEHTYVNDGLVHNWTNRIVEYFLSADPKLVCNDTESQAKIDAWAKTNNFREKLKLTFQHKYIFGNSILRWVNDENGRPVNIDFIDPKFFDAVREGQARVVYGKDGNPIAYVQYLD